MIYLFDKQMQLTEVLNPMTAVMSRRLIGVDRILVEDKANLKPIIDNSSYAGVFYKTRFYIFRITQTSLVNNRASFEGVNYAYDELANISIIEDKRPENVTASIAVQVALEGTGWTLGAAESTSLQSTNFYYITPLQAIQKVIETWQIEPDFYFEFDGKSITGRRIDVLQRRGSLTGERYVYGSDLLEIVHEEDRSEIVTAIIGRGKGEEIKDAEGNLTGGYGRRIDFADVVWSKAAGDPLDKPAGQLYLEVPEMTALYGYPKPDGSLAPRIEVFIDDQQTDPAEVLRNTYRVLIDKARPLLTISSTVAKAGPYELGDTNYIIRPDLGFYYEARIFEDAVDLLNPNLTKFKFGDYIPSGQAKRAREIKAQFEGLNEKINGVDQAVKGEIIKVSTDWYDALMDAKAEMFFSGSSYNYSLEAGNAYGLPAGFYSFDAPIDGVPGPTNFLTIHAGKLGRGTILPGGNWDFNLIGDASGLTADAITAGKIKAQFIEIGSSSTFLEGYDPSTKAETNQVYTKTQLNTIFEVRDGQITQKITAEVTDQIGEIGIYKVDIISTNGLVFKNDNIATTLIARVYKNNTDITDTINSQYFKWTKINADGTLDTAWNTSHIGGFKQVTITGAEVSQRASFTCEITEV